MLTGESSARSSFLASRQARQGLRILRDGLRDGPVVNALATPTAFNEASIRENLEVVGNGGWGNTAEGNKFTADHPVVSGDGLEDLETGGIGQSLGNLFDLGAFHSSRLV
jgi:hypothetical protein